MGMRSMGRQGGEFVGRGEDLRDYIQAQVAEGKMAQDDASVIFGLHLATRLIRVGAKSGGLIGPAVFAREHEALMADCDASDRMVAVPGLPAEVAAVPSAVRQHIGYDLAKMTLGAFGEEYAAELVDTTDIATTPLERARRAEEQAETY